MTTSLLDLKGIGEKGLIKLNKIGIKSIEDLLFHLPIRYQDKTKLTNISDLEIGKKYLVQGVVEKANVIFYKKRMFVVRLSDKTGSIQLRFFYFNKSQVENFIIGRHVRCFGELRVANKIKEIVHPECQFFDIDNTPDLDEYLTPIYPITEGLHQYSIRNFIKQSLALLKSDKIYFPEILPKKILEKYNLVDINSALFNIHKPEKNVKYENYIREKISK